MTSTSLADSLCLRKKLPGFPLQKLTKVSYGLWAFIAFAVTLKIIVKGADKSVYPVFATASEHWWQGLSLYANYPDLDLYRYSPLFAILFSPFSWHDTVGQIGWVLISYGTLLYASKRFFAELIQPITQLQNHLGTFLILVALGSVRSVWNGQSNILLVALAMLGVIFIAQQRWWLAGLFLTLATFIKIWPIALCALLAAHYPKQLIPRFVVLFLVLVALPFITSGAAMDQYLAWWQSTIDNHQGRWPGYRDAWTIWEALVGTINHQYYQIAQVLTGLLTLGLTFVFRREIEQRKVLFIFCAWITWQLTFGPGTERATYSIFAPAFAFMAVYRPAALTWLIYPTGFLFLLFTHGSMERTFTQWFSFAQVFITASALIFGIWMVAQTRRTIN